MLFSYTIILLLEQVGWLKPDFCVDTIPKQLNFEFDKNIDKTKNVNQKC